MTPEIQGATGHCKGVIGWVQLNTGTLPSIPSTSHPT